jgi:hypothetical protein
MWNLKWIARGLVVTMLAASGAAAAAPAVNVDRDTVAIGGYDVVAYFADGTPKLGLPEFSARHDGATYRFASATNLAAFRTDPNKYLPQYGGYCAYGAARGYKAPVDPTAWRIHDGRLYLNYNHDVQRQWLADIPGYIRRADENWPRLRDK